MIFGGSGVYAASDGAGRVSAFWPPASKPPTWSTGPTYLHSEPLSRPADLGFAVVQRTRPVASRRTRLFFGFTRPVASRRSCLFFGFTRPVASRRSGGVG